MSGIIFNGTTSAVVLDRGAMLNLAAIQAFLGDVNEESAKKWLRRHAVPRVQCGRTWLVSADDLWVAVESRKNG